MDRRLAIAVIAVISAIVFAGAVSATDRADAAGSAVSEQSITVFTPASDNLNKVVYVGTQLPEGTYIPGLAKTDGDMWYTVDTGSSKNGTYLTYGDLTPAMSNAQIVADLVSHYGAGFTIFQISFKVTETCNVSYSVAKDSTEYVPTAIQPNTVIQGFDCKSFSYVRVLVGGTDIPVSSGTYTLNIKCNGLTVDSASASIGDTGVTVSGTVRDSSGEPVYNATVRYNNSNGTNGIVLTDAAGHYAIPAFKGQVIRLTSVEKGTTYTFPAVNYNSGTLSGDYAFPDVVAAEVTVKVRVTDAAGTHPLEDVRIGYIWYVDTFDAVSGNYTVQTTYSEGYFFTDSAGIAKVLVTKPVTTYNYGLYVYANFSDSPTSLSFTEEELSYPQSPTAHEFLRRGVTGSQLVGMGNDFADLSDLSTIIDIRSNEYVFEALVNGAKDGSAGGAPLLNIPVKVEWRYQVDNGGSYEYPLVPSDEFIDAVAGRAFVIDSHTDAAGEARIAYTVPTWSNSTDPKLSAYLYVGANNSTSLYNFSVPSFASAGGTSSLPDLVSGYAGAIVLTPADLETARTTDYKSDALLRPTYTFTSDEVAYEVVGTVTGTDLPSIKVTYAIFLTTVDIDSQAIYTYFPDPLDTGTAEFRYTVPAGYCSRIELATEDGYEFGEQTHSFPNSVAEQAWSTTLSVQTVPAYVRITPVALDTYSASNLSAGDVVTFQAVVSGFTFTYQRTVTDPSIPLTFTVMGADGAMVSSGSFSAPGVYFPEFSGTTVAAVTMTDLPIVTFSSADGVPTLSNVLKEVTVRLYVNDDMSEVKTSTDGTATVKVPDGATVVFKYYSGTEEYAVTPSVMSDGPFAGRTAVNLSGIIDADVPVDVTVTEEQIVLSSLYNTAEPTSKVLRSATVVYSSGSTVNLTAPSLEGFIFSGWYFGNECLSEKAALSLTVEEKYDGGKISAVYAPAPYVEPEKGIDPTTLMIGLVAIMIAIMCFAYVLLTNRRY